jgi:hypothetical protein
MLVSLAPQTAPEPWPFPHCQSRTRKHSLFAYSKPIGHFVFAREFWNRDEQISTLHNTITTTIAKQLPEDASLLSLPSEPGAI